MKTLDDLLVVLGYYQSPHYRSTLGSYVPNLAHALKLAAQSGVSGVYTFKASPAEGLKHDILPERPAVYIAQAKTPDEARTIHRTLWNLGQAPFLIVLLENQIRIYTGFEYSHDPLRGLIAKVPLDAPDFEDYLKSFRADAINSGQIWRSTLAQQVDLSRRVDARPLASLKSLETRLELSNLKTDVAHSLIGKYIYIRYLF